MDTRFLLLWFEAPLQSWGADSKFGRRDSLPFPTKSGVLGLICAALGASGEQKEMLAEMAPLKQTVISYRNLADRQTLLRDFHMVGSGYDRYDGSDKWYQLNIPKTADGKNAVGGGTKMTYRYYLQDAKFAVIVEVPNEKAKLFSEALQNPVYDIYLGRKSCVPTDFVFRGIFNTESEASTEALDISEKKELAKDFRVVSGEAEGESLIINDVPLQFGPIKKYKDRRVTIQHG
ncbi:type I-E CRISPR-associated protein Cas5/CasD [Spirochaetia bacterium]|nr:type I-E CRISPR-associated protein Cas5/CasD [Spirochaetia bacterium]